MPKRSAGMHDAEEARNAVSQVGCILMHLLVGWPMSSDMGESMIERNLRARS